MDHRLSLRILAAAFSIVFPHLSLADENDGRFMEAIRRMDAGNYAGAVDFIETELRRAPVAEDAPAYALLAVAALRAGMDGKARAAAITALADDPTLSPAWTVLEKLRPAPAPWAAADLPEKVRGDADSLLPILGCGRLDQWPKFAVRGCVNVYGMYAARLTLTGRPKRAERIRELGTASALKYAFDCISARDFEEADVLVDLAVSLQDGNDPSKASRETQTAVHVLRSVIDVQKRRYLHAIADLEHVAALGHGRIDPELSDIFARLLFTVYESISWEPETGMLRVADPDDFFDSGIAEAMVPALKPGLPYGMASAEEDRVTCATALITDGMHTQLRQPSVDSIVRDRLRKKNFELPVKVVLQMISLVERGGGPVRPEMQANVNRRIAQIEKAMGGGSDIPDATLDAFEVAKRAWALLPR